MKCQKKYPFLRKRNTCYTVNSTLADYYDPVVLSATDSTRNDLVCESRLLTNFAKVEVKSTADAAYQRAFWQRDSANLAQDNLQTNLFRVKHPFGMEMPGRTMASNGYRYGFNGKEKDTEGEWGTQTHYDYGFRIYEPGIGRFLSVDPLAKTYPSESNFVYAGNNPIYFVDIDGKFRYPSEKLKEYREDYPMITKYLALQVKDDVMNSSVILGAYKDINKNITNKTIGEMVRWNHGYNVEFVEAPGPLPFGEQPNAAGYTDHSSATIQINARYAKYVEDVLSGKVEKSTEEKKVIFTRFYMTLLHEQAHAFNGVSTQDDGSVIGFTMMDGISDKTGEDGEVFEKNVWGFDPDPFQEPVGDPAVGIQSRKYYPEITEAIILDAQKTDSGKKTLPTMPNKAKP